MFTFNRFTRGFLRDPEPGSGGGGTPPPGITKEDHDKAVRDAVARERQRLNDDIEASNKKTRDLQAEIDRLKGVSTTDSRVEALQKELDAEKAKNVNLESKFDTAIERVKTELTQSFQQERLRERVENRRELLIEKANGEIIPSLVKGNTIEELEASAAVAKEEYKKIFEAAEKKAADKLAAGNRGVLQETQVTTPGQNNNGTVQTPGGQETTLDLRNLHKMSEAEWVKQREALKQQAFKDAQMNPNAKAS